MQQVFRNFHTIVLVLCAGLLSVFFITTSAHADYYSQLQILLPGETAAPETETGKTGSPLSQTVGVPFTISIRACDNTWNTVTTVTNVVEVTSSDASATLPSPVSLYEGEINITVTLNASGTYTFSAEDQSDHTIPLATSSDVISMALQGFEFSRINQKNQYAGQPMSIDVMAVDANGDVVTGFSGQVILREITSYGEGRIEPDLINLTDGNWSGSVTLYRADETSINRGNVNIVAVLQADITKNGISDPFTVHPGEFHRVQIVVPGQEPLPGSVTGISGTPASQGAGQSFDVEVYATDEYWNPLESFDEVLITSSDPEASTPVSGVLDQGFQRFMVSLSTVGTQTLTVTDQTNGSILSMTSEGIMVIANVADHFEIDPITSPIIAGDDVTVTIRATDVGGNTRYDYFGDAILIANTGPGSINPEDITFSEGVWTGQLVFRGAGGSVTITCSDFSSPPHTGTSNSFQVLPGPYEKLQVLLPGETPKGGTDDGQEGSPTDQNAGSSFNIMIRAVDQFWNRVEGINNHIALSSSDVFADIPAETTLTNGELTLPITLYKAGYQTVVASDVDSLDITPYTSSVVRVLSGPYARVLILAPGEVLAPGTEEGRTGTATDQSITYAFSLEVYATDDWWNPITGVSDIVRITCSDPLAELPPDTSLVDGYATMSIRLSTGGYQQITVSNVTQPLMPSSTTQVRAISSGLHLETEVSPTLVQAGEEFTLMVRVTNDAGSIMQEVNSSVTIEVQNASTQEPGQGQLLTTHFQLLQGQRTVIESYTFAEPIVLILSDDEGNAPAVTEVVTVTPADPATVTLSSDPEWVRGNKHATVSALVADEFGNGVPDQAVVFHILSGTGTLTAIDSLTNSEGIAQADFLSPRVPEIDRIRASSNGLFDELDIETALVDPSTLAGTVTNYPNPFHPSEAPTTIAYKIADDAVVTLRIFTLTGDLVLRKDFQGGGSGGSVGLNEFKWDGRNGEGEYVSSGGYILVIEAVGNGETLHVMRRKLAVVR
jgi:hypothetical protein